MIITSIEEGRKQDGNRSIADKIIKRLHDLDKTIENNQGRWAWELLQNAKDSIADEDNGTVSIQIELDEDTVEFRHNGTHFTEHDVRGLINQISSKEVEEGVKTKRTGRFGTGFLTTHLLSKIVNIGGILKAQGGKFYKFEFPLDRKGKNTSQLMPKIENAWQEFHKSAKPISRNYDKCDFNTYFRYQLDTKEQQEIAKIGIEEFSKLIPFVLTFIPKINKVEIIDNTNDTIVIFENNQNIIDDIIVPIIKTENDAVKTIYILNYCDDKVSIATELEETEDGYSVRSIKDLPKLFCDFPLIGTEDFHFPVVVNSFHFHPQTERDGVWLKGNDDTEVEDNQEILEKAVELYGGLIDNISERNFTNLFNIAQSEIPETNDKYFDETWFKNYIQKPIREVILKSELIETGDEIKEVVENVRFPDPSVNDDIREKIWEFSNDLAVNVLPLKTHIHEWAEVTWDSCGICDFADLAEDLKGKENLNKLQTCLNLDEDNTIQWLQNFYEFLIENNCTELFNKYEIVPNRLGIFQKVNERTVKKHYDNNRRQYIETKQLINNLHLDELNDDTLLDISSLIGLGDWRENLIHSGLDITALTSAKIDIQSVANDISTTLKDKKEHDENGIQAIRRLSEWFDHNEDLGKKYFPEIFKNRAKLFLDTIDDRESLYQVMKSNISLSKLSEIAIAIENDPEILNIINRRQKELQEEQERNEVGEKVELILGEILKKHGFNVQKVVIGKDLIITINNKNIKFEVEVKSTNRKSWVAMTPTQGEAAVKNRKNYILCVVYKNGSPLTKAYVEKNAKFVMNIGQLIKEKVEEVAAFVESKDAISYTDEDIDLMFEADLEYKYRIGHNVWQNGISISDFINKSIK